MQRKLLNLVFGLVLELGFVLVGTSYMGLEVELSQSPESLLERTELKDAKKLFA